MVSDLMKDEDLPDKPVDLFPKGWTVGRSAASLVRDGENVLLEGKGKSADESPAGAKPSPKKAEPSQADAAAATVAENAESNKKAAAKTTPAVDRDLADLADPDTETLFDDADDDLWASSVFVGSEPDVDDAAESSDPCNDTGTFFLHPSAAKEHERLSKLARDDDATEVRMPAVDRSAADDRDQTRPLPQLGGRERDPLINWSMADLADERSPRLPADYDEAVLPDREVESISADNDETAPMAALMDHQVVEVGAALTALRNDSFRRPARTHGHDDADQAVGSLGRWGRRITLFGLWALVALLLMVLFSAVTVVEQQRSVKAGVVDTVVAMGDQIGDWASGIRGWITGEEAKSVEEPTTDGRPADAKADSDGITVLEKSPEEQPVRVDLPAN